MQRRIGVFNTMPVADRSFNLNHTLYDVVVGCVVTEIMVLVPSRFVIFMEF